MSDQIDFVEEPEITAALVSAIAKDQQEEKKPKKVTKKRGRPRKKVGPTPDDIQPLAQEQPDTARDELLSILASELRERQAKRKETEDLKTKVRLEGAKAMQTRREKELAFQESCTHLKRNGEPAIGGQKDHNGDIHTFCLFCSKHWIGNELPAHLRISLNRIGGPN